MKSNSVALIAGVIFAVGLALSGMTQPAKVIGFLDFFGNWDPSLAFVMGGAVIVNMIFYRITMRRPKPVCEDDFCLPTNNIVDAKLIGGSALFGIGWGLGGFCPGPALTSLASLSIPVFVFVAAMGAGMYAYKIATK